MVRLKYLDTYALVEISRGNPKFMQYAQEEFITSDITLSELYGVLLREFNERTAEFWLEKIKPYSEEVHLATMIAAIKLRRDVKNAKISFFDAVGYTFAKEKGAVFVTGDNDFKSMKDVELIKS